MAKVKKDVKVIIPGMGESQIVENKFVPTVEVESKDAVKGLLISVVDYPTIVSYNGGKIRLTGRATEKILDVSKLEKPLPNGVKVKEIPN